MRTPRLVPWASQEEWEFVRECLYADPMDWTSKRLGVDRVKAWRSRGKLPHAIDSTAAFVEVLLRDDGRESGLSLHELRLLYTAVFIRFVNGIVDHAQRGAFASSAAGIAERLNMPLWFVELRHAGTHEYLPSLQVLRAGSQQALQWLAEQYWSASARDCLSNSTFGKNGDENNVYRTRARNLLNKYKEARKQFLKDSKIASSITRPDSAAAPRVIKEILAQGGREEIRSAIPEILLEPGYLVPTGKKKRVRTSNLVLPPDLLELWSPLLKALDDSWPEISMELALTLVDQLDVSSPVPPLIHDSVRGTMQLEDPPATKSPYSSTSYLTTIAAWVRLIILPVLEQNDSVGFSLSGIDLDDIIERCLRRPNPYTQAILITIAARDTTAGLFLKPLLAYMDSTKSDNAESTVDEPNSSASVKKTIQSCVPDPMLLTEAAMSGELKLLRQRVDMAKAGIDKEDAAQGGDCRMEEQEEDVQVDEPRDESSGSAGWTLYAKEDWKPCAIGCLPGSDMGSQVRLDLRVFEGDSHTGMDLSF